MLFADVAHRDLSVVTVDDRMAKDALCQKDAFGVVAERAMAEVGNITLRLIDYVDNLNQPR